jgi:hypothetical protein
MRQNGPPCACGRRVWRSESSRDPDFRQFRCSACFMTDHARQGVRLRPHRPRSRAARRSATGLPPVRAYRRPGLTLFITESPHRPSRYSCRSRQSHIPKAPRTTKATALNQSGISWPPAVTRTRRRTRSACARAMSQNRIAATSDAGFFISVPCLFEGYSLDALRDACFARDWPRSSSHVGGTAATASSKMGLVLRIEELQRRRREHATAMDAGSPVDGLPQRRTGYVLDHEAGLIGAIRSEA